MTSPRNPPSHHSSLQLQPLVSCKLEAGVALDPASKHQQMTTGGIAMLQIVDVWWSCSVLERCRGIGLSSRGVSIASGESASQAGSWFSLCSLTLGKVLQTRSSVWKSSALADRHGSKAIAQKTAMCRSPHAAHLAGLQQRNARIAISVRLLLTSARGHRTDGTQNEVGAEFCTPLETVSATGSVTLYRAEA